MKKENEDNLRTFIDIVDACSDIIHSDPKSTSGTLVNVMMHHTGCSREEAQTSIDEIIRTVDRSEDSYNDLRKSISKGSSREEWLLAKIQGLDTSQTGQSVNEILSEVSRALNVPSVSADTSLSDGDLGNLRETIIIQDIVENMQNINPVEVKVVESFKTIDFKKEISALKEYFDSPLNSEKDAQYVKAVSSAAVIAKEKGLFNEELDKVTNSELTMIVDQGMSTAKAVYQVGTGEVTPLEAQGYILDKKTSKLGMIVEDYCAKKGRDIGANIGATIGAVFGPVGSTVGAAIGAVVGYVAGKAVGKWLSSGLEVVSDFLTDVGNFITDTFDSIVEFFSLW